MKIVNSVNLYGKSPNSNGNNGQFSVKIDPFNNVTIQLIGGHFTGTEYFPTTLADYSPPDLTQFSDFILMNSEIDVAGNLTYIMFLASQSGLIEIDVI